MLLEALANLARAHMSMRDQRAKRVASLMQSGTMCGTKDGRTGIDEPLETVQVLPKVSFTLGWVQQDGALAGDHVSQDEDGAIAAACAQKTKVAWSMSWGVDRRPFVVITGNRLAFIEEYIHCKR